jgi:hypothetical protein
MHRACAGNDISQTRKWTGYGGELSERMSDAIVSFAHALWTRGFAAAISRKQWSCA